MKLIMNLLWLIFGGIFITIAWFLIGVLLYITIIGIPFAKQCFKMAELTLAPFGRDVRTNFDKHPIANIIWAVVAGWEMALANITTGLILCITIIGIPFGLQCFKIAVLSLFPFGAKIK
jgi:uncharacterized membrane protein YccF (DUF307 family)